MDSKEYVEMLERHGVKVTANRIVVARELDRSPGPMTMAELERKILTIDKSGIFRVLTLFKEHHLVHVIEDGGGSGARYELCRSQHGDKDDDEHPHFHCEACGRTFCLEDTSMPCVNLPEGFQQTAVSLIVKGICPECAKQ
ncbi:MAG: transcriptional repressor [Prevotella sp.]|nr:transcriptional repressor [Prevotella sp.]